MPKKKKKRGTAQDKTTANDADKIDHLMSAKQHGVASDGLLHQFREQQELRQARGGGSRESDTPLLGLAGNAVMHRNMELQDIVRHAATGDVSTKEGRGVLWTGDKRSGPKNETVEVSAMRTAQNSPRRPDGRPWR